MNRDVEWSISILGIVSSADHVGGIALKCCSSTKIRRQALEQAQSCCKVATMPCRSSMWLWHGLCCIYVLASAEVDFSQLALDDLEAGLHLEDRCHFLRQTNKYAWLQLEPETAEIKRKWTEKQLCDMHNINELRYRIWICHDFWGWQLRQCSLLAAAKSSAPEWVLWFKMKFTLPQLVSFSTLVPLLNDFVRFTKTFWTKEKWRRERCQSKWIKLVECECQHSLRILLRFSHGRKLQIFCLFFFSWTHNV